LHDHGTGTQGIERAAQRLFIAADFKQYVEAALVFGKRLQCLRIGADINRLIGATLSALSSGILATSVTTICKAPARRAAITVSAP